MTGSQKDYKQISNSHWHQLKKKLADKEEKLEFIENIVHSLPAIVYLFDIQDLEMIWCNERHKQLIGFDTTGMNLLNERGNLKAISQEDQSLAMENIKGWRQEDSLPSQVIIRITDAEGKYKFFNTNHYTFKRDEDENPKWILGVGINITKPVESEHEKRILYSEDIVKTQQLMNQMSDRERQVLKRLADGKSYGKVAEELNLSVDGVRYHIRNIYEKFDVHTRAEAIKKGMKYRLFNP